jgi:hypothetical protein
LKKGKVMKLSALRQQLAVAVDPVDLELFSEMGQAVRELGDGRFLPVMHELLQRYEKGAASPLLPEQDAISLHARPPDLHPVLIGLMRAIRILFSANLKLLCVTGRNAPDIMVSGRLWYAGAVN